MRYSIKTLLLLIAVLCVVLIPVGLIINFRMAFGPAEVVANKLHSLAPEIVENQMIESQILDLLRSPVHRDSGIHALHADVDKRDYELIWFAPNQKYSVGLANDGAILWMVDGKRTRDVD